MNRPTLFSGQSRSASSRRGAMLVLIVVMLIGFMVTVAFSVDIAQMHLSRTELRSATDAAAKAAAQELSRTLNQGQAIARGQAIAALNTVNGDPLLVAGNEFEFGQSTPDANGKFIFSTSGSTTNSVRVLGKRTTDSLGGPVPLFFGNILGVPFFEPAMNSTATYLERDVVLVVDRSGSMAGQKAADLVSAIDIFVTTLDTTPVDEQVGLASYNDQASQDVQLTTDLQQISDAMRTLPIGGFTSISRGMDAGEAIMNGGRPPEFVSRTMIVMTDGRHNRGIEPRIPAQRIADEGVQIHTITFGNDADIARMQEVATIGNGQHFHAVTGDQLRDINREIALTLGTMITE